MKKKAIFYLSLSLSLIVSTGLYSASSASRIVGLLRSAKPDLVFAHHNFARFIHLAPAIRFFDAPNLNRKKVLHSLIQETGRIFYSPDPGDFAFNLTYPTPQSRGGLWVQITTPQQAQETVVKAKNLFEVYRKTTEEKIKENKSKFFLSRKADKTPYDNCTIDTFFYRSCKQYHKHMIDLEKLATQISAHQNLEAVTQEQKNAFGALAKKVFMAINSLSWIEAYLDGESFKN